MDFPGSRGPWPDHVDLFATSAYLLMVVALPTLGYYYMAVDFRAYLRSLRRALVVVGRYFPDLPEWARVETPRSIAALGLTMPCTEADVLRAYRQRVKQLHPDRGGNRGQFLRLQAQFEEAVRILEQLRSQT